MPVPITIIPKAPSPILQERLDRDLPWCDDDVRPRQYGDVARWRYAPRGRHQAYLPGSTVHGNEGGHGAHGDGKGQLGSRKRRRCDGALPSDPDVPAVSLSFTVGPAPSLLPKGATVPRQCSQASGSSCVIPVIGGPGEVNPLPNTPLAIASVAADTNCPGVTFTVTSSTAITASWSPDTPGSTCTATFAVKDALGSRQRGGQAGHACRLTCRASPRRPRRSVRSRSATARSRWP